MIKKLILSLQRHFASQLCDCGDLCLIIHQTDQQLFCQESVIESLREVVMCRFGEARTD